MRLARATGLKDVAIPCAACFARFKETQHALRDPETAAGSRMWPAAPCLAT